VESNGAVQLEWGNRRRLLLQGDGGITGTCTVVDGTPALSSSGTFTVARGPERSPSTVAQHKSLKEITSAVARNFFRATARAFCSETSRIAPSAR